MKKLAYIFTLLALAVSFSSCEKEKIENTAVVDLAGEWIVTVDAVDADGTVVGEDFFGIGEFLLLTYNDNSNDPTKLVIDDLGAFWEFTATVGASVPAKTFSGEDVIYYDEDGEVTATVSGGSIVTNGTLSPYYQRPVDSIEFHISFSDDPYPALYGYDHYLVHGFRRTGFAAEDI